MTLTERIKAGALDLGFAFIGVTTADPPAHFVEFTRWLAQGRHGAMAYLSSDYSRAHRADPRALLPGCRSIIVVGLAYDRPDPAGPDSSTIGRVAAYAQGVDYHDVIPGKLHELHAMLEAEVGHPVAAKIATDSAPLLERDLAQRAGLGWIAKNTCLIRPGYGSYFLLGELLVDVELDTDEPFTADHCGSCRRCIEACPTACILPDRTLDARRCISYLTIELKGSIAVDLRPLVGDWVFGCDICQQVCPWNIRFAPASGDPSLSPRMENARPDLIEALELDAEGFNRRFRGTPLTRSKRRGYARNAAVVLGSRRAQKALPALRRALHNHDEPLVRAHAAWALGQIGAVDILRGALPLESDAGVIHEIESALARASTSDID